ncbi:chaperone protein dnaJ 11, chloroplastic [Argentina anserina]|uniref:chaperone protein dnaJ 11, chloroplastic n=1 Tax=Argentina anserina TaxID=57926 RepID=UPI0021765BF2|nr:chaperone protein dnaJ 11, chloroplastic [Potentilla anserina]
MSATLALSGLSFTSPKLRSSPSSLPEMPLPRRQLKLSVRAFAETERRPMTATSPASLYEVLQVKNNASQMEIKTAYRSLAKMHHPDASSSAAEADSDGREFIEIHNAYATLSDPAARAMYDLTLNAGVGFDRRRSPVGFRPNGFYSTRRWETDQCW